MTWNEEIRLLVYIEDGINDQDKNKLEDYFKKLNEIEKTKYISENEAWKKFKEMFAQKSDFLTELDFNPLPASYVLKLKPTKDPLKRLRELAGDIRNQRGVESVDYGEKWIGRFETFMILLRVFLTAIGALLALGAMLIISNTIKLSVFSRRDEIELMLLIGAKPGFIKAPFFFEGIIHGLLGAGFSLIFVKGIQFFLKEQFQGSLSYLARGIEFKFISSPYVVLIISLSIFLGWLGSYVSVNQFLNSYYKK